MLTHLVNRRKGFTHQWERMDYWETGSKKTDSFYGNNVDLYLPFHTKTQARWTKYLHVKGKIMYKKNEDAFEPSGLMGEHQSPNFHQLRKKGWNTRQPFLLPLLPDCADAQRTGVRKIGA